LGDSIRNPSIIRKTLETKGQCPGELFISLGGEGIYGFSGDEEAILPLPKSWDTGRTMNRSGSGDALLAALVWSRAKGYDLAARSRYAMTAALLASTTEKAVLDAFTEQSLEKAELELFGRKGL
jgi:pseudouridine kinase